MKPMRYAKKKYFTKPLDIVAVMKVNKELMKLRKMPNPVMEWEKDFGGTVTVCEKLHWQSPKFRWTLENIGKFYLSIYQKEMNIFLSQFTFGKIYI